MIKSFAFFHFTTRNAWHASLGISGLILCACVPPGSQVQSPGLTSNQVVSGRLLEQPNPGVTGGTNPSILDQNSGSAVTTVSSVPQAAHLDTSLETSVRDMRIVSGQDRGLSGNELLSLIAGRTIYSQTLDNPDDKQVGKFLSDGSMQVIARGQVINSNWSIKGNQLCYPISGREFCSYVHLSAYTFQGQPIYYFRRASGEATVVITAAA